MIIDSLTGLERYFSLHPHFEKVFQFLRRQPLAELPEGRYEIDGDRAFVTLATSSCKEAGEALLETHDSYIDIHLPLEGFETIGWRDRSRCSGIATPYDEAKDIAFYDDVPEVFFTLEPMNLAIVFPHDAHAPLIGRGSVKKIVAKIKVL
jgi:YhcH/YjgK/YiaL family protein